MASDTQTEDVKTANMLKDEGNDCIKRELYREAALLYTQAIKIEPENEILYSNRSLSYLKLQQHALALNDANEAIRLKPNWAKGHFRKAEAQFAMGLIELSAVSYTMAHTLLPDDPGIKDAICKLNAVMLATKGNDQNKIPWLFSCIGLIFGVILTIYDFTKSAKQKLTNPLIQVLFIQSIAGIFWLMANVLYMLEKLDYEEGGSIPGKSYRYICSIIGIGSLISFMIMICFFAYSSQFLAIIIIGLLVFSGGAYGICKYKLKNETQNEIYSGDEPEEEENIIPERTPNKYTKAQARYRYKKGKKM